MLNSSLKCQLGVHINMQGGVHSIFKLQCNNYLSEMEHANSKNIKAKCENDIVLQGKL